MSLKSLFKLGKTHVPHYKNTAEMPAVRMPAPAEVLISMSQNIGAPSVPKVSVGDTVYVGTLIGEAGGYVGAPVHSSVSGTVKKIDSYVQSSGRSVTAILIESDGNMTPDPSIVPPVITDIDSLSAATRASGLIGLGGAGFPTSVKLDAEKKGLIKKIILNGAECEPYITSDTRTMLDDADLIKEGVELLLKYISADELIIGIEKNKPECIAKLTEVFADNAKVSVSSLPDTYPQGGEKVLVYHTLGRVIGEGKLPLDSGVIVINCTTLAAIARYVKTGMPLVERCVTVDGSAIKEPKNVIAPIGVSIAELIEFAGGFCAEPKKILYGGPMMGMALPDVDRPLLKQNNAVLAFAEKEARTPKPTACIGCGRCQAHCPLRLSPNDISKAYKLNDGASLEKLKVNLCMECGCCSYVCPAKRQLVQTNKLAKATLREYQMGKGGAK